MQMGFEGMGGCSKENIERLLVKSCSRPPEGVRGVLPVLGPVLLMSFVLMWTQWKSV